MRSFRTALLAGAAAVAIGFSGAAMAQNADTRVMTVRLPDGGIAQIRYTGNVAPQVSFRADAAPIAAFAPISSLFGSTSPFAELDRISAEMDRRAAVMFRQAQAVAAGVRSGQLTDAAMRNLPPGSQSYSFISTMSGSGVCTQSVEIAAQGNGAAPRVVSHSSGNCGPSGGASDSVNLPTATPSSERPGAVWINAPVREPGAAPMPQTLPDVVWTSAHGAHAYAGLVEPIPAVQR